MVVWGIFFSPKPEQTCLICPPELPRGEKMHIGGVSKLVPLRAGISPVKTEWTAQMLSFILPFMHRLHFISHWSQQQKIKSPLLTWGESWGRGCSSAPAARGWQVGSSERGRSWGATGSWGCSRDFLVHLWAKVLGTLRHPGPNPPCGVGWFWQLGQVCGTSWAFFHGKRCWICSYLVLFF